MIDFGLGAYDDLQARQDEGVDVPIYDPGTDVVLFTIRVHGTDSKRVDRARQRRDEEAGARGALSPMTAEEAAAEACLFLARCCSGWEAKSPKATLPPFSDEACAEMLRRYRPIRDTVDGRVSNRAVFIKRSSTASAALSGTASLVAP